MFRRAVFALMLIGAAFAGGAAINGPGLAWLQRNFAGGPSIIVDRGDPGRPQPSVEPPPRRFPTAKGPPLVVDIAPPSAATKKGEAKPPTELALAETPLLPESSASALAPLPSPEPVPPVEEDPPVPPLPSDEPPPRARAPEPARLPRLDDPTPRKTDPVARLASVERTTPPVASTWADLRQKMKDQGISRYTLEAETDGRVRFRCVIPVDGLKAVGHHFEAEGDDEPQAIEAALKRIALWKATSSPED